MVRPRYYIIGSGTGIDALMHAQQPLTSCLPPLFDRWCVNLDHCSPLQLISTDVSHNIAKIEHHMVGGRSKRLLVHRKGSTRAFPPHHPMIPVDYQWTGQPVLIGGTMGTCSYVLTGTEKGFNTTFGSTCHGAGRAFSRAKSRRTLNYQQVLDKLNAQNISIRVASPKLVMEEAPESYKDVEEVVNTCHAAGISKKSFKLRPVAVVKG